MGRPRQDRRVVTYSLAKDTLDRIAILRDHEQDRLGRRTTRVTFSEIVDNAIRELDRKTFMDDDPTNGGRFFVPWTGSAEWRCPFCVEEEHNQGEAPSLAGGWIVCPYVKCGQPRPTASYPEPLPTGWKVIEVPLQ